MTQSRLSRASEITNTRSQLGPAPSSLGARSGLAASQAPWEDAGRAVDRDPTGTSPPLRSRLKPPSAFTSSVVFVGVGFTQWTCWALLPDLLEFNFHSWEGSP